VNREALKDFFMKTLEYFKIQSYSAKDIKELDSSICHNQKWKTFLDAHILFLRIDELESILKSKGTENENINCM